MKNVRFSGSFEYKRITQWRKELVLIDQKKRTCYSLDFAISADDIVKIMGSKELEIYLVKELKKQLNMKVTGDTNSNWCTWNRSQVSRKYLVGNGD